MSATSATHSVQAAGGSGKVQGLLAELDSPGALLTAAEQVRDGGYRRWDTHSPFPVHGIDEAMGTRPTRLPWIVFCLGVMGCLGGVGLVWFTNATNSDTFPQLPAFLQGYDFLISGKPIFSLQANIPVIFETTVLLAAFGAVFGMLAMNNLPLFNKGIFHSERFKRVTADRFFVFVSADDPNFDMAQTQQLMTGFEGVAGVETIYEPDASTASLPRWLVYMLVVVACLALFPPLFVAKARLTKSTKPRIHIIQDMDNQPRYEAQQPHPRFADGRSQRAEVGGTVARVDWPRDAHFHDGKMAEGGWVTTYPPRLKTDFTAAFVTRGQRQFNIYCAPCHGLGGAGDGIVNQRAFELDTPGWVPPTSMLSQGVLEQPHGQIYNSITNGVRTMPPYGDQIPPRDRWAIVAYIRALQRSQQATVEDVPPAKRSELR